MLPTSFANHALRALFEGFEAINANPADERMLEKYMLGYFVTYRHLLRDYSRRDLSKEGDALRAWSGIATLLQRFANGKEVICGMPTAAIDLAILWTSVGDPLGSRKLRGERAEAEKKTYYPSWSWTSMTDPMDLLVSQRWCGAGEGLVELIQKMKDDKYDWSTKGDQQEVLSKRKMYYQAGVRSMLRQISKMGFDEDMSDERPFVSDVNWIGIQDGRRIIRLSSDPYIGAPSRPFEPAEPVLLEPSPPTEVLHFEADMVSIDRLWHEGGYIITTKAKSWYTDIAEVMKQ